MVQTVAPGDRKSGTLAFDFFLYFRDLFSPALRPFRTFLHGQKTLDFASPTADE
jgi:hypothetical protein